MQLILRPRKDLQQVVKVTVCSCRYIDFVYDLVYVKQPQNWDHRSSGMLRGECL
jgi:hypothetical protein